MNIKSDVLGKELLALTASSVRGMGTSIELLKKSVALARVGPYWLWEQV